MASKQEAGAEVTPEDTRIVLRRRELTLARQLTTRACTRVREVLARDVSERTVAGVRAAMDGLQQQATRLSVATRAVVEAGNMTSDQLEAELAKEIEYEAKVVDLTFDVEEFLRENDPGAYREERSRGNSISIQHQSSLVEPQISDTRRPEAPKMPTFLRTSWDEVIRRVPKFDGDPVKFKNWQNAFRLYVDSTDIDPLEKFHLLKAGPLEA